MRKILCDAMVAVATVFGILTSHAGAQPSDTAQVRVGGGAQVVYTSAAYSPSPGFPAPQVYDHSPRPIPEIRYTVQVTGSWRYVPR